MRARIALLIAALALTSCGGKDDSPTAPATPTPVLLMSYPSTAVGGDGIGRGFYIPSYPGTSLSTASIWMSAGTAGSHTVRLIARNATFDGTVIDSASSTVTLPANTSDSTKVTFNFTNKAVTKTTPVTFTITYISGPSTGLFYGVTGDYGALTGAGINLVQTNSTTAPLDTFRRNGIAFVLTGLQ
ncbi:MAG: hypothetical protein ABL977_02545 [Candidatus Eisenbacteria bacterium]